MIGNNKKNFQFSIFNFQKSKGFTLIEVIVSIAVFAAAVTVASSIFVSSVGSQRKNVNHQEVLDNGRFVLETIGRAIRQSSIITNDGSGSSLNISHPTKGLVTYLLENNQIKEVISGNSIALSSSGIYVEGLNFLVQGNSPSPSDDIQPRVVISIFLGGQAAGSTNESNIKLQTTITPRNLQVE